jgi:hypothetical protein
MVEGAGAGIETGEVGNEGGTGMAGGNDTEQGKLKSSIENLKLSSEQKAFLTDRLLDQWFWMEGRAATFQSRYYCHRVIAIAGGAMIPALAAFAKEYPDLTWAVVVLGVIVALASALEEFFKNGERWRHYRGVVEALKREWWRYYELFGPYAGKDHAAAFPDLAKTVEDLLAADVDAYIKMMAEANRKKA